MEHAPGGAFLSAATAGKMFAMEKVRTYGGPRMDLHVKSWVDPESQFSIPPEVDVCGRWAVINSIVEPTHAVKQLAAMSEWCVVVVGDKNGVAEYNMTGVTYLTPADQDVLPYRIGKLLPWNHFGRKNIGYMYAIHHGAEVIYDVDDRNALIDPHQGVPHSDVCSAGKQDVFRFHSDPSAFVHNPYPCFGAPGLVWPRGFPLDKVQLEDSSICSLEGAMDSQVIGVVQALANHYPDVDAIYRMTRPHGGLPFTFATDDSREAETRDLRVVPASTFTPYNAQATLHFEVAFWGLLLPTTVDGRVSDTWRSYFTQSLLPAVGAVAAFSPGWVEQVANTRNNLADFKAELPLYQRSGALAEFLLQYRGLGSNVSALPLEIEALAVTMYEYGIVEDEDVALTQAWLEDLRDVGYVFPEKETQHQSTAAGVARQQITSDEKSPALQIGAGRTPAGELPRVLLVVAILSARPERRDAIRSTWLAWGDERVGLRFFTEAPAENNPDAESISAALEEEMEVHQDVVLMDIDSGMNFALKLVWTMRWVSHQWTFDFFLRLDDDYFLCLRRLLDELETTFGTTQEPTKIYAGHITCGGRGKTRIDEAYMLLSASLVTRVLSTTDLMCASHGGVTAGWWFTPGNPLNEAGDVTWVHDPRLDHSGKALDTEGVDEVCERHMGLHHVYPDRMVEVWNRGQVYDNDYGDSLLHYAPDQSCGNAPPGVSQSFFNSDHAQPCETFKGNLKMHCGGAGC
ncbi:unnamed protein product [Ectocarpus sp. 13 AM-2016]